MKIKIVYILEDENKHQNIDSEFSSCGIIIDIYFIIYIFKISVINLHYIFKQERETKLISVLKATTGLSWSGKLHVPCSAVQKKKKIRTPSLPN